MMNIFKKQIGISEACASSVLAGIIAAMFFYAAVKKLTEFDKTQEQMLNQVFPDALALELAWFVPLAELFITFLLVIKTTQFIGFVASFITMAAFSLYIAVTMTGVFGRVPCSCGGILNNMGYGTHLIFNLLFVGIAFTGMAIDQHWMGIELKS